MIILMELLIQEIGKKINNMAMEQRFGQTAQFMKAIMKWAKNMALACFHGLMVALTQANFIIIISMEEEYTLGVIPENTKENGEQIKCMVKGFLVGLMEGNILESIMKIKKKVLANLFFKMVEDIVGNGLMENKQAKGH